MSGIESAINLHAEEVKFNVPMYIDEQSIPNEGPSVVPKFTSDGLVLKQDETEHPLVTNIPKINPKSRRRRQICNMCGRSFTHRFVLVKHKSAVHGGIRPFVCHTCGSAFCRLFDLRQHKNMIHNDEIPNVCDVCGKSFKFKSTLVYHKCAVQEVVDKQSFACDLCGSRFSRSSDLRDHKDSVHTAVVERKHACETCGKCFKYQSTLVYHRSKVHKDKRPFVCDICGACFSRLMRLTDHKSIVHEDTQPSPETPNIEMSMPLSVSEPTSLTVPIQSVNTQFTPEPSSTNQNNMWTVLVPVPYTIILPVQAAPAVAPQPTLPYFNFLLPTNTSSIPDAHLPNTGEIINTESAGIPRRSPSPSSEEVITKREFQVEDPLDSSGFTIKVESP